jgi:hypothetical protein
MDIKNILQKLPKTLPDIQIKKLPSEKITLILKSNPSFFAKFGIGDKFIWVDYDFPSWKLSHISLCWTAGPVLVDGFETIEWVSKTYTPKGKFDGESYSYNLIEKNKLKQLLFIYKGRNEKGTIETAEFEIPLKVSTGDKFEVREVYKCGKLIRDEGPDIEEIDGPFLVELGKKKKKCLRWIMGSKPETKKKEFAESFISIDDGLTFLFRRYNGEGWHNYKFLKKSGAPKIEYSGIEYYLWYINFPIRDIKFSISNL